MSELKTVEVKVSSYFATCARLWDTLKAELEAEATHHDLEMNEHSGELYVTEEATRAAEFLERMRRMEDRS